MAAIERGWRPSGQQQVGDYVIDSLLDASGAYGRIFRGRRAADGVEVAIKTARGGYDNNQQEAEMMQRLQDDPRIVQLLDVVQDEGRLYIVMELVEGGDLFNRVERQGYYPEEEAKALLHNCLLALKTCHDRGIVHRDVKCENIFIESNNDNTRIKLGDLGLAEAVREDGLLHTNITSGTPGYLAPEQLLGQPCGKQIDMWALGVVAYTILCGYPPWKALDVWRIQRAQYQFHTQLWEHVSDQAKNFIRSLLQRNPAERMSVDQALEHDWFAQEQEQQQQQQQQQPIPNDDVEIVFEDQGQQQPIDADVEDVIGSDGDETEIEPSLQLVIYRSPQHEQGRQQLPPIKLLFTRDALFGNFTQSVVVRRGCDEDDDDDYSPMSSSAGRVCVFLERKTKPVSSSVRLQSRILYAAKQQRTLWTSQSRLAIMNRGLGGVRKTHPNAKARRPASDKFSAKAKASMMLA